jgi:GntR family transcriptional regulator, histidine utilization repressor
MHNMNMLPKAGLGFRDVRDEVLRRIRSGPWPPGTLVPAEAALAEEFGVARATVSRAMQELAARGYVERRRKGGTRVRPRPERSARLSIPMVHEEIEQLGLDYSYQLLNDKIVQATTHLQLELGIARHHRLRALLCLHMANGIPFQVEERWINLKTLPDVHSADFSKRGPNEWLVERVPFTDVAMKISAVTPPLPVAKALGQKPSLASLKLSRTTWLNSQSVTHVNLYFRGGYDMSTVY